MKTATLKSILSSLFFVLVLGVSTLSAQNNCTANTPSFCDISTAGLEVNLGPIPIDVYTCLNASNTCTSAPTSTLPGFSPIPTANCSSGSTIQYCYQQYLLSYKSQGITGVRFQFGMGGGAFSTAVDTSGHVSSAWVTNLGLFLNDIYNAGITNVTVTPNLALSPHFTAGVPDDAAGFDRSSYFTTSSVTSCSVVVTLLWVKWLPYGLTNDHNVWPDCQDIPGGYTGAHYNDVNFWGWGSTVGFRNIIDYVLYEVANTTCNTGNTKCNGVGFPALTLEELDLQNEIDLLDFPVQGLLIYDNDASTPFDVLGDMQIKMNGYYPTADKHHVTYSAQNTNPFTSNYTCLSVYGDSALIADASELQAALGGGYIGIPTGGDFDNSNGLACLGSGASRTLFPVSYGTLPTLVDVHVWLNASPAYNTTTGSDTARNTYDAIDAFLTKYSISTAMLGEVNHNVLANCTGYTGYAAFSNVNGFNVWFDGSQYSSALYRNHVSSTTFRMWSNPAEATGCYPSPAIVAPPYCLTPGCL